MGFCNINLHIFFMPYVYSRPYVYSFWQIFQALRLFPALRLFQTLEYVYNFGWFLRAMYLSLNMTFANFFINTCWMVEMEIIKSRRSQFTWWFFVFSVDEMKFYQLIWCWCACWASAKVIVYKPIVVFWPYQWNLIKTFQTDHKNGFENFFEHFWSKLLDPPNCKIHRKISI